MFDGIVLAGGFSSRMKKNKMTLKLNDQEIIMHTINNMHEVCENIIVVTGFFHNEITKLLKAIPYVKIVENKEFRNGMFSSVKTGVREANNSFFIIPGDYPLVKAETYLRIANGTKSVRVPSYKKHLGHPLFVDMTLKEQLLGGGFDNLKAFRNANDFEYIEVDDPGILIDMDTMGDFENIKERIDSVGS